MLKEKGVIKYPWLFKLYCDFTDSGDTIRPNTYQIYYNYDYHALVSSMTPTAERATVRITIPEGWNAAQIFALMESNEVCSVADLENCAANTAFDYWFLEGIPYGEANRLEGFLFPDTYDFYEHSTPREALGKMLLGFEARVDKEQTLAALDALNQRLSTMMRGKGCSEEFIAEHQLGLRELLTVASSKRRLLPPAKAP